MGIRNLRAALINEWAALLIGGILILCAALGVYDQWPRGRLETGEEKGIPTAGIVATVALVIGGGAIAGSGIVGLIVHAFEDAGVKIGIRWPLRSPIRIEREYEPDDKAEVTTASSAVKVSTSKTVPQRSVVAPRKTKMRSAGTPIKLTTRYTNDIKATGGCVELSQWVYVTETRQVTCKVKRPNGDIDRTSLKPTVGLATTVRLIYPDDFRDEGDLAKGDYKVVWTEGYWKRPNISIGGPLAPLTTFTNVADEWYETTIGSGEFTVR